MNTKYDSLYDAWNNMKQRCLRPGHKGFHRYGGRGITICNQWLQSYENFRQDMLPLWQKGLQLDRIDNNRNYEPSNCRWATRSENMKNTSRAAQIQSRFPGVSYCNGKWRICAPRLVFTTEEEAYAAYLKVAEFMQTLV